MLLHAIDVAPGRSGHAEKSALLLHGMMGSAESWHRVIPLLADRGYRVLSLDLPGHGLSPRDPEITVDTAAASVIETVDAAGLPHPVHAIGHSLGATVLAASAPILAPEVTVYVDSPLRFTGHGDRNELVARYQTDRATRTDAERLHALRPYYSAQDIAVEARAAERFDPSTAASVSSGEDVAISPRSGDVLIHADPSRWVTDADIDRFTRSGVSVRSVSGAEHTIWYSHLDAFTASLPEMFEPTP
ncbi:alpha/beta fold hydrolase [Microbacterium sp. ZW T5_45]|uniref:alpha/beta fold hydrolase n=1 Tax=Microbacterium sp. ZW T5_45 TaxID=3378080 RepID=UPI0038528215